MWSLWTFLPTIKWKKMEFKQTLPRFADSGDLIPGPWNRFRDSRCTFSRTGRCWDYMQMSGLRKKTRGPFARHRANGGGYWVDSPASGSGQTFSRLSSFHRQPSSCFRVSSRFQELSPWSKELLRCRMTRTIPGGCQFGSRRGATPSRRMR